jgi:hypothetical protein
LTTKDTNGAEWVTFGPGEDYVRNTVGRGYGFSDFISIERSPPRSRDGPPVRLACDGSGAGQTAYLKTGMVRVTKAKLDAPIFGRASLRRPT